MALITDPDDLLDASIDDNTKSVYINPLSGTVKLVVTGNLSTDGVTLKALYSFLKEEWRVDPNAKNLAAFPFPMVPITDESFEFVDGWDLLDDTARYLIRTGGWNVRNTAGNLTQKWSGVIGLGSIEADDQLYFNQGQGAVNVQLTGQVNQAISVLSDPNGDGNFSDGYDRRTTFKLFVREQAQLFGASELGDIGVTTLDAIAYRFPITTATDLNVTTADTIVSASAPYEEIKVRYFAYRFRREVDTTNTYREFGVVIDAGTHSGVDGSIVATGNVLTSSIGGFSGSVGKNYASGTLIIHSGAAAGTYVVSGAIDATHIQILSTFPETTGSISFTVHKSASLGASAEQIYESIQYDLRQNSDINHATGTVTGKIADQLLQFVGSTLEAGTLDPVNSLLGGNGVIIEGFEDADRNRLTFRDNTATNRSYPFIAILTLQFGANLIADANARYWVYFTTLPGGTDDFGQQGALIVDDNDGADMSGSVGAQSSITLTFNYDGNVQGGRTAATTPDITAVAIGLNTGQYVRASGQIARSISNTVSLVAPLERNYSNL